MELLFWSSFSVFLLVRVVRLERLLAETEGELLRALQLLSVERTMRKTLMHPGREFEFEEIGRALLK